MPEPLLRMREVPAKPEGEDAASLREELAAKDEEILRLRDLLIGKDAELGAAKGRLAELEDQRMRVAGAKARLASYVPGLRALVAAALRVLRDNRR
jgi:hypothetical protein